MYKAAPNGRYLAAGVCVLFFLLAQTFQEIAYWRWIPASQNAEQDLLTYLMPVDKIRAYLVMSSILSLLVAYVVVALRYYRIAPVLSVLGLIFGTAFVGFEVSAHSFEIFVIGQRWAQQFHASADAAERGLILGRFVAWTEAVRGWYFPQMLSHLLAALLFGLATMKDRESWRRLATLAFFLNALRLLGRLLSTYGGQTGLAGLNDKFYYPAVALINAMVAVWFFHLARSEAADPCRSSDFFGGKAS
jgi:hypothetical protein